MKYQDEHDLQGKHIEKPLLFLWSYQVLQKLKYSRGLG